MATTVDYSYIQSLIQQLGTTGISNATGSTSGASQYLNSVFGSMTTLTSSNATSDQKTQTIVNAITKLVTSLLSDLGTGASSKADQTINNNNTQIDNNTQSAEDEFQKINDTMASILDECQTNTNAINNALAEIEKLGGDQGQIATAKAQLNEQLKIIEEQKRILNDPDSDAKDRKAAIAAILGAADVINGLVEQVSTYEAELTKQQDIVTDASAKIDDLGDQLNTAVEEGGENISENLNTVGDLTADNTEIVNESQANTEAGAEQVVKGTTIGTASLGLGSGLGQQYIAAGNDKIGAGIKLMTGAIEGFGKLSVSSSTIKEGLGSLIGFAQGIDSVNQGSQQLVGLFNENIDPMLTSVGSWQQVAAVNNELQAYTIDYASQVGMSENEIVDSSYTEKLGYHEQTSNTILTKLGFSAANRYNNKSQRIENNSQANSFASNYEPTFAEFTFDTNQFKSIFETKE